MYYKKGDIYVGGFKNGSKDGHGLYEFINGDIYNGEFI